MGEVINLRQARKRQERAAKEAEAGANRARFGRTKAQRLQDAAQSEQAHKSLAAHKREKSGD